MLDKILAFLFSRRVMSVAVGLFMFSLAASVGSGDGYVPITCDENDCALCLFCGCISEKNCYAIKNNCDTCVCNGIESCYDTSENFICKNAENCTECTNNNRGDSNAGIGCIVSCSKESGIIGCLDTYCTDADGGFAINCDGKKESAN